MATADNAWMPTSGRYAVKVGASLARVLKARKGGTASNRPTLVERDFYSFRYNFKPESIDPTKPGFIEAERGKETSSFVVERSSTQSGEFHLFNGIEKPAKEWECVLIYDDETGTFTLEKLESFMTLTYDKKSTTSSFSRSVTSASPAPAQLSVPIQSESEFNPDTLPERVNSEVNEYGTDGAETILAPRLQKEELGPSRPHLSAKAKSAKSSKSSIKPRARSPDIPLAQSRSLPSRPKTKIKRDIAISDVEEEELTFGQPARPMKRRRHQSEAGLALPSGASTGAFHGAPNSATSSKPKGRTSFTAPTPPPPVGVGADSESEEEWDEVEAPPLTIDIPSGEEDDLEAEMKRHMEELPPYPVAFADSPEPEAGPLDHPISLHERASRDADVPSDDDITSSDDSSDSE